MKVNVKVTETYTKMIPVEVSGTTKKEILASLDAVPHSISDILDKISTNQKKSIGSLKQLKAIYKENTEYDCSHRRYYDKKIQKATEKLEDYSNWKLVKTNINIVKNE